MRDNRMERILALWLMMRIIFTVKAAACPGRAFRSENLAGRR